MATSNRAVINLIITALLDLVDVYDNLLSDYNECVKYIHWAYSFGASSLMEKQGEIFRKISAITSIYLCYENGP